MSASQIEWVLFDIGGVLLEVDFEGPRRELARRCSCSVEELTARLSAVTAGGSPFSAAHLFRLGKIRTAGYLAAMISALGLQIEPDELQRLRESEIVGPMEAMVQLLPQIGQQKRLACFSNSHDIHWRYLLSHYSFPDYFEIKMASHLAGVEKPQPQAWRYICERLETAPAGVLLIDDLVENVQAARDFGMTALHFVDKAGLQEALRELGVKTD